MPSATTSDALHDAFMNYLLKGSPWSILPAVDAAYYIALYTTMPNSAGSGGVEVSTSGTNYARKDILRQAAAWTGPAVTGTREISNAVDVLFLAPTANWGTIVGASLISTASGAGTIYYTSTLQTAKTVNNGDGAPKILAGQFRIARATCP